jgi:hypothetical protein
MPRIIIERALMPVVYEVTDGTTLQDFMLEQHPESKNFQAPVVAIYGGKPVLRKDWSKTVLTGDDVATFKYIAEGGGGGGGSNPLKIIAGIILIVIGAVLYACGQAWATPLIGMGVSLLLGEVVNAIFGQGAMSIGHVDAQSAEAASPTYSINANSNQARLFQAELEVLGKLQVVPDTVTYPYSRYVNNEMYLYQVFAVGRGRYVVHSMAFGDVVFWKDGHLIDSAYVGEDEAYSAYSGAVLPIGSWTGAVDPAPATAAVRRMVLQVTLPDGCCSYVFHDAGYVSGGYGENGNYLGDVWQRGYWTPIPKTVSVSFQIRELNPAGEVISDWVDFASGSAAFTSESAQSFDVEGHAPAGYSRYQIRALNTSAYTGTLSAQETQPSSGGWGRPPTQNPPITVYQQARERMVLGNITAYGASVQVEIIQPGGRVTLFPDNVETSTGVAGQDLIAPNAEGHEWIGPFPVCPPGTTTNKISLDFVFPQGIGRFNDSGGLDAATVSWVAQYQLIDDSGAAVSGWATLLSDSITMATQTPQRRTYEFDVPMGRYQAQCLRTSDTTGDGRTMDLIRWEALRALLPGQITYPQTVIAICIKANNRLSQKSSERFSTVQTRVLPLYDRFTKTWSGEVPTRSFAAAVCSVAKSSWGGRMKDAGLDLNGLWELDEKITAKGWSFDAAIDGPYSVWALLVEICSACRVIPRPVGTVLTFVMDEADRPVRHVFTPHNILRDSFQITWATFEDGTPDDVIVTYLDEAGGYAKRDVRAILPDSESLEPAQRQPIGIVNRPQAHAFGCHLAAGNRFRRILIEFQTEAVGRLLNVGDIISVTHPRLRGAAFGKLVEWNENTLTLRLASTPVIPEQESAQDMYLSLTDPQGRPWGPVKLESLDGDSAKLDALDYAVLLLQGAGNPFEWMTGGIDRMPTVWTIQTNREFSGRFIVKSISPVDLYRYTVTAMNDDSRVYTVPQSIPVPPWEYRTNEQVTQELATPQSLSVAVEETGENRKLRATWLPVPRADAYTVEYSMNGLDFISVGKVNINAGVITPPEFGTIWVRVNAVNANDMSDWAVWSGDTSMVIPAAPEVSVVGTYADASFTLVWKVVAGNVNYAVQVFDDDTLSEIPVHVAATADTTWQYTLGMGLSNGGPYRNVRVHVRAVNSAGYSEPGIVTITYPAPDEIALDDIQGTVGEDSFTVTSVGAVAGNVTGYVIARGANADFSPGEVLELRTISGFPYTWVGLTPDTVYHFRIAAKDSFFDASQKYSALNYSGSLTISTSA